MKKLSILFLICLLIILPSCDNISNADPGNTIANDTDASESSRDTTAENSNIMEGTGKIGDFEITIKSCTLSTNYKDEPSVIITYDFTNHSDKAQSFMVASSDKVFQNGIECETTVSNYDDDSFSSENQMKEIKTGATLEVQVIYKLNDSTSDIEVEVSELFSFADNPPMIVKTFSLN